MIRVVVRDLLNRASRGIWILQGEGARWAVAKPVPLEFSDPHDGAWLLPDPTLEFSYEHCQQFFQGLCDALSELGYRPNTDRLAGELEATKKHLDREKVILDKLLNRVVR